MPPITDVVKNLIIINVIVFICCLLYTSDAADERSSVDLGGRRIIKKKNSHTLGGRCIHKQIRHKISKQ